MNYGLRCPCPLKGSHLTEGLFFLTPMGTGDPSGKASALNFFFQRPIAIAVGGKEAILAYSHRIDVPGTEWFENGSDIERACGNLDLASIKKAAFSPCQA